MPNGFSINQGLAPRASLIGSAAPHPIGYDAVNDKILMSDGTGVPRGSQSSYTVPGVGTVGNLGSYQQASPSRYSPPWSGAPLGMPFTPGGTAPNIPGMPSAGSRTFPGPQGPWGGVMPDYGSRPPAAPQFNVPPGGLPGQAPVGPYPAPYGGMQGPIPTPRSFLDFYPEARPYQGPSPLLGNTSLGYDPMQLYLSIIYGQGGMQGGGQPYGGGLLPIAGGGQPQAQPQFRAFQAPQGQPYGGQFRAMQASPVAARGVPVATRMIGGAAPQMAQALPQTIASNAPGGRFLDNPNQYDRGFGPLSRAAAMERNRVRDAALAALYERTRVRPGQPGYGVPAEHEWGGG